MEVQILTLKHKVMNKKKIIFWSVIVVIVIAVILFIKLAPLWVSLPSVASFGGGTVIGWIAKILYDKYIKK